MRIRFWGTRGSLPKPGPSTARYGGNTSCVEVRSDAGTLIVLDCGTGGHALGLELVRECAGPVSGSILISHTHWDHIQGIPFFDPLFIPGNHWDIYGPKGLSGSIREALSGQMQYTYFPITIGQFAANVGYHDLVEGSFRIGEVAITTRYLNHPALTLGYRIAVDGATLVYCCDHEPSAPVAATGERALTGPDKRHAQFFAGADLVIHDAQYLAQEYPAKVRWGHSTVEYAVRACEEAGARRLAITHYDPAREDAAVDQIVESVRAKLALRGSALELIPAAEGKTVALSGSPGRSPAPPRDAFPARSAIDVGAQGRPILLLVPDDDMRATLMAASLVDEQQVDAADSAETLLRKVREAQPSLVILQHSPPQSDGIELARAVRALEGVREDPAPIVCVAPSEAVTDRDSDVANEWLVKPFSQSYARTKIRAWVLRSACRWMRAQMPKDEARRIATLERLQILDTEPEARLDRITRLASSALNVPVALVSLVDGQRQWFKSRTGIEATETVRDMAFCSHVVLQGDDLIVTDALQDDRFADNPLVVNEPRVRFYAGAPLMMDDGSCLGSFCVIDMRPREFSAAEIGMLHDFRDLALEEIRRRRS